MKKYKIKYTQDRRTFIANMIKAGVALNLPAINSCFTTTSNSLLTKRQDSILEFTLNYIWPDDGNGPSISEANIKNYFIWMLEDKNFDPEIKTYLYNGIKWIDETVVETYNQHFEELKREEKISLFNKIIDTDWGDGWISKIINYIFEALFSDPIYGSNTEGISYKWLDHNPGYPRPDENNRYEKLLLRKTKEEKILSLEDLL